MENMNIQGTVPVYTQQVAAPAPERTFSPRDFGFAAAAAVCGFMCIKLILAPMFTALDYCGELTVGFGAFLTLLAMVLLDVLYLGKGHGKMHILRVVMCLVFAANTAISGNGGIKCLDTVFVVIVLMYDLFACAGRKSGMSRFFPVDALSALTIMPLSNLSAAPIAAKQYSSGKKSLKNAVLAIAGLAAAAVPTVIVTGLLSDADTRFSVIISSIFDGFLSKAVIFVIQAALGIPIGLWFFGALDSAKEGISSPGRDEELEKSFSLMRIAPSTLCVFAVIPLCIVYVIFFFSQLSYNISAFNMILPAGAVSYSEYAREGFFELCKVSVIDLCMIAAMRLFGRREDGTVTKGIRIMTAVLSVMTIGLIFTAMSKMMLYIAVYSLTRLRVYTSWFMVLLGMVFIVQCIWAAKPSLNIFKPISAVFIVMFGLLSFGCVDTVITEYNTDKYLSGELTSLDIRETALLSSESANVMYKKADRFDDTRRQIIMTALKEKGEAALSDVRAASAADVECAVHAAAIDKDTAG